MNRNERKGEQDGESFAGRHRRFWQYEEGGYYYVDKTLLIRDLPDKKGETNLLTRSGIINRYIITA